MSAVQEIGRRTLLGAALALPLAGAAQATPSAGAEWDGRYAQYREAARAVVDYERDELRLAGAQFRPECAASKELLGAAQRHFGRLVAAQGAALEALMLCPAPTLRAVSEKIEILIAEQSWECVGFPETMGHLLADLRRLPQ